MNARMEVGKSLSELLSSIRFPCHAVDSGCRIPFEPEIRLPKKVDREMMHECREAQLGLLLSKFPYPSKTA